MTPPVVYNAGLLRAIGRGDRHDRVGLAVPGAGQQLFYPPNVSGWDFAHWLDTSTAKARWEIASYVTAKSYADPWPGGANRATAKARTPEEALAARARLLGQPAPLGRIRAEHRGVRQGCLEGVATAGWQQSPYRAIRQNALRMLIATSPDMQVS